MEEESVPAFDADEIEELVDEVEETRLEAELAPEAPEVAAAAEESSEPPTFEIDATELGSGDRFDVPVEASAAPAQAEAAAPIGEPQAVTPEPMAPPQFEVDHRVDPEWGATSKGGDGSGCIVAPRPGAEFEFSPVPAPPPDEPLAPADERSVFPEVGEVGAEEHLSTAAAIERFEPARAEPTEPSESDGEEQVWELGGDQPLEEFGTEPDDPALLDALRRGVDTPDETGAGPMEATAPLTSEPSSEADAEDDRLDLDDDGPEVEPQAPAAEVALTDALGDRALFEDPDLDVARLTREASRQIVIPVELEGEKGAVRRYKLSIRLRLDPVD
jgi:hypothetical protein